MKKTFTYDLKDEKQIYLEDFMKGKYLKKLTEVTRNYFKNIEPYKTNINNEIFLKGTSPSKENYKNFLLTDDSLILVFEKYQIFPGSFGIISIEIPKEDLKGYLKIPRFSEDYLEVLGPEPREYIKEIKGLENRKVDPSKPMLALTSDDGPSPYPVVHRYGGLED